VYLGQCPSYKIYCATTVVFSCHIVYLAILHLLLPFSHISIIYLHVIDRSDIMMKSVIQISLICSRLQSDARTITDKNCCRVVPGQTRLLSWAQPLARSLNDNLAERFLTLYHDHSDTFSSKRPCAATVKTVLLAASLNVYGSGDGSATATTTRATSA
jgi:hypothetical protein